MKQKLPRSLKEFISICDGKTMQEIAEMFFEPLGISSVQEIASKMSYFVIGTKKVEVTEKTYYTAIFFRILWHFAVRVKTADGANAFYFTSHMRKALPAYYKEHVCGEAISSEGVKHNNAYLLLTVEKRSKLLIAFG